MSDYVARSPDTNQTGHRRAIIPANAAEIRDEGGALLEFDVFCCNETRTEIMNRYRNVCHQATRQYEKCGLVRKGAVIGFAWARGVVRNLGAATN